MDNKQSLTKELIEAQGRNQKLFFKLKKKDELILSLQKKVDNLQNENDELKSKFKKLSESHAKCKTETRTESTRKKSTKSKKESKIEQPTSNCKWILTRSSNQQKNNAEVNNEIYEVEAILDHKFIKDQPRKFFIRWKNFDDSMATWEAEDDLNCSQILNQYLKSKNIA